MHLLNNLLNKPRIYSLTGIFKRNKTTFIASKTMAVPVISNYSPIRLLQKSGQNSNTVLL